MVACAKAPPVAATAAIATSVFFIVKISKVKTNYPSRGDSPGLADHPKRAAGAIEPDREQKSPIGSAKGLKNMFVVAK
jgi:hypothetical protein